MAQKKRKAVPLPARMAVKVTMRTASFPMPGVGRVVRVQFPYDTTAQERYDVAVALAKVSQQLIAEADALVHAEQKKEIGT